MNGGLSWENYAPSNPAVEKLVIAPPLDKHSWFLADKPREWKDETHFSEKVWAGIGEINSDAQSKEKHLLQSIETYNQGSDYTNIEVWGGDGEFYVSNVGDKGYAYVSKFYEKGQGWKSISGGSNISETLKNWYKPFKEKKIKWSSLRDKCSGWSSVRGKSVNKLEQDMRTLCYSK